MAEPESPIRVLIVDDEVDVRVLLRVQLGYFPDLEVVGESANGQEALTACAELRPDVVVLDLLMPRLSGFEAIDALKQEHPEVAVIAYSAVAGDFVRQEMQRLDVELVLKGGDAEPLVAAIRRAAADSA